VGVSAEVAEHVVGAGEGSLRVHHPVLAVHGAQEPLEGSGIGEVVGDAELATGEPPAEVGRDDAAEQLARRADREQEATGGGPGPGAVLGEGAAGDDAVDVGVEEQLAGPGVQDHGHAEGAAEAVAPEGHQGLGGCGHHEVVDEARVGPGEHPQLRRQREDDVEVWHRQHPRLALCDPLVLGVGLTGRTVSVPAGVVDGVRVPAGHAVFDVTAEPGGATAGQRREHAGLRRAEHVRPAVGGSMATEDLRDPEGLTDVRGRPRRGHHRYFVSSAVSGLRTFSSRSTRTRRYRWVVSRLVWPRRLWITTTLVPSSSRWVANAWRRLW